MSVWTIRSLRAIIAIALLGSVVVQAGIVAALWVDAEDRDPFGYEIAWAVIGALGVGCLQVVAVCIWRLLTMVRRGTVFSHGAFRYVDLEIAALGTGAFLIFGIAGVARFANHAHPGDEVAPGLGGRVCGFARVTAGVALVVLVMRALLAQAVDLDSTAKHLRSELDEVI